VKSNREIYWPSRDERTCAESHLLTYNKFDFVLQAIEENPFNTTRFGWIDMNLKKDNGDIKICENYHSNMIPYVLSNIKDEKFHIQIMNVNDKKFLSSDNKKEYYEKYRWVVCGCFFVCTKNIGIKILNRLKEIVETTTNAGFGHGEEPMFLEILEEFYDDIARSYGDYHHILDNFENPMEGLHYIFYHIASNYYHLGYKKECKECCEKIINSFDNLPVEEDEWLYSNFNHLKSLCN
jgi:hypothetical protein